MRRVSDRGSVLMLMPAAVVIVLLLGAIAVDAAIVHLRVRQGYNVAFDAANDAAGAGVDPHLLRTSGQLAYDPTRVEAIARQALAASGRPEIQLVSAIVDADGVAVTVSVTVEHLFAPAFGDAARSARTVTARADGEVRTPAPVP